MIFQQRDVEPEGMYCIDSVVLWKPSIKNYFRFPVINDSKHDITKRKNLTIRHLENVSSIVTSDVTERTAKTESNINKQKPSTIDVLEISERLTS